MSANSLMPVTYASVGWTAPPSTRSPHLTQLNVIYMPPLNAWTAEPSTLRY
jgi:hypothetical protein